MRGAVLWVAELNGYARVEPPLAEFEATLLGRLKSSRPTDLWRVIDPISQRTLALRPDITAQVGRIAATRMAHRPRPLRLCYAGQVLKVRGTMLRPEREMCQAGCEIVGADGVAAVVEAIRVALDALTAAGATGLSIDLTLPDLVPLLAAGPMPLPADRIDTVIHELDGKDAGALADLGASAYLPLIEAAGRSPARSPSSPRSTPPACSHRGSTACARSPRRSTAAPPSRSIPPSATASNIKAGSASQSSLPACAARSAAAAAITIVHPDGTEEPAVGFSLFLDPIVDAGVSSFARDRVFVPLGTDPAVAAAPARAGPRHDRRTLRRRRRPRARLHAPLGERRPRPHRLRISKHGQRHRRRRPMGR